MERAAASSCAVSTTPAQSSATLSGVDGARSPLALLPATDLHFPDDRRAVVGRRRGRRKHGAHRPALPPATGRKARRSHAASSVA